MPASFCDKTYDDVVEVSFWIGFEASEATSFLPPKWLQVSRTGVEVALDPSAESDCLWPYWELLKAYLFCFQNNCIKRSTILRDIRSAKSPEFVVVAMHPYRWRSSGNWISEGWYQFLRRPQNCSPLSPVSRNFVAISFSSLWTTGSFQRSRSPAGRFLLVLYDLLHARVASMNVSVSLIEARWKPSCSHNPLTDGTLLNATDGFWDFLVDRLMIANNVKTLSSRMYFRSEREMKGKTKFVCERFWKVWEKGRFRPGVRWECINMNSCKYYVQGAAATLSWSWGK